MVFDLPFIERESRIAELWFSLSEEKDAAGDGEREAMPLPRVVSGREDTAESLPSHSSSSETAKAARRAMSKAVCFDLMEQCWRCEDVGLRVMMGTRNPEQRSAY